MIILYTKSQIVLYKYVLLVLKIDFYKQRILYINSIFLLYYINTYKIVLCYILF